MIVRKRQSRVRRRRGFLDPIGQVYRIILWWRGFSVFNAVKLVYSGLSREAPKSAIFGESDAIAVAIQTPEQPEHSEHNYNWRMSNISDRSRWIGHGARRCGEEIQAGSDDIWRKWAAFEKVTGDDLKKLSINATMPRSHTSSTGSHRPLNE